MPKPNVKNPPFLQALGRRAGYYGDKALKAAFGLVVRLGRGREVAANNYNLGLLHLSRGDFGDAVFRFKAVTWLEPGNVMAWYNLGTAYLASGKPATAASCYRKTLALQPGHEEAAYMLAIARGAKAAPEEMPKKIPLSLALSHFDALAAGYDKEQVEMQKYRGHELAADAVRAHAQPGRIDHAVLDLGAGTGLFGVQIRNIAGSVTGVDISQPMLALAMEARDASGKKAYDALIQRDAVTYLKETPAQSFDIVAAVGLPSFIGDLQEIFALIAQALKPGGLLVFSAEKQAMPGYRFEPAEGRFRFSGEYLQKLAQENGLSELKLEEAQASAAASVWLGVFRK